jgi:hypothetical protein
LPETTAASASKLGLRQQNNLIKRITKDQSVSEVEIVEKTAGLPGEEQAGWQECRGQKRVKPTAWKSAMTYLVKINLSLRVRRNE